MILPWNFGFDQILRGLDFLRLHIGRVSERTLLCALLKMRRMYLSSGSMNQSLPDFPLRAVGFTLGIDQRGAAAGSSIFSL